MPVATSYTEIELAEFMKSQLKDVAVSLGWETTNPPSEYQEAVNETILSYGVTTIDLATDVRKLRTLARREVWRAVMQATASRYRFGSDREVYFRQQVYEQASQQYSLSSIDASIYEPDDPRFSVGIVKVIDRTDPYTYYPINYPIDLGE